MNREDYGRLADAIRGSTVSVNRADGSKSTHISSALVSVLMYAFSGDREFDPYSFVARCNQEPPL